MCVWDEWANENGMFFSLVLVLKERKHICINCIISTTIGDGAIGAENSTDFIGLKVDEVMQTCVNFANLEQINTKWLKST